MITAARSPFPKGTQAYVIGVFALGVLVVALSVTELVGQGQEYREQWLSLVGLTLVSGLLPVTLPTVNISISVSETFVIAGTLLFGGSGGTVLVLLDALLISLRLTWSRRLRWQQILFNLAAPPLSIWTAAKIARIHQLFGSVVPVDARFIATLALFALFYFLFNSWLLTFALALQQRAAPHRIWWTHFKELLVNYAAGGSIAALLVYNTRTVDPAFVAVSLPLLIVLYLTYQWSNKRVEAEREKNAELNRVFLSTIEALALAIDAKDQVTHGHIRRVQRYTMSLAEALGLKDEKLLDALRAAALLHDTGKLAVPEYILNKPGPLTSSEFERMKVHAAVGADILKSIAFPYPVEPIVRHHHESWDGSGYPEGIKGQEIPLGARILSVVDCYDALTSDRPYRPRYTRQQAEQVLRERRGVMYDPWVVDEFLKILDKLERMDAAEEQEIRTGGSATVPSLIPAQLDVISATTAEEREFNELRRDLPKATSLETAAEALFRHLRRVVPAASLTLFMRKPDSNELHVVACSGVGSSAIQALMIPIGERISGWAFANKQVVENSDATLDLGPVAKTFSVPLRYALAVPLLDRHVIGVVTLYGSEPFNKDHLRVLESAGTLFVSSVSSLSTSSSPAPGSIPATRPTPLTDPTAPAEASQESGPPKPRVH
jgi:putative nucleotidyltransferase with HDIG domain